MALRVARSAVEWQALAQGFASGADQPRAVVSVGNFDGLHIGHQKILRAVVERAKREHSIAAAITFDPHPLKILRPETAPLLLMTMAQRLAAFEQMGIDAALVMRFDAALAQLPAKEFVRRVLVETVHAGAVLVGANFRFGHKQIGDVALLQQLGRRAGFDVEIVPAAEVNGKPVSSTAIRRLVANGDVEEAALLLGHPFILTGPIQSGEGRGSKIVVPTLNLAAEQEILPRNGVYVTETLLGAHLFHSVTNVGTRPTFNGSGTTVESHLLDSPTSIAEGRMEVRFWKRLREERKFEGPEELRTQIKFDIDTANEFFEQHSK